MISSFYNRFIGIIFLLMPTYLIANELIKDANNGKPHAQYLLGQDLLGKNNNMALNHLLIASTQGHLKSIFIIRVAK